eukprot:Colp12_sorted_trinity150504_noHs@28169
MADPEVAQACLAQLSQPDAIMGADVLKVLITYIKNSGLAKTAIRTLSENYRGYAQMANLVSEWLVEAGETQKDVEEAVEGYITNLILQVFEPRKAESIFKGGVAASWIDEMIKERSWRNMIYELLDEHKDSLMLNYTIQLISSSGHQAEIASRACAVMYVDVFNKVLSDCLNHFITSGEESFDGRLKDFTHMACRDEHIYLYTQGVLHALTHTHNGHSLRRIAQEVERAAGEQEAKARQYSVQISGAPAHPNVCAALLSMLAARHVNSADVTAINKAYAAPNPPQ